MLLDNIAFFLARHLSKVIIVTLLLSNIICNDSHASEYSPSIISSACNISAGTNPTYSACQAAVSAYQSCFYWGSMTMYTSGGLNYYQAHVFSCSPYNTDQGIWYSMITQAATPCTGGGTIDMSTGMCQAPQCPTGKYQIDSNGTCGVCGNGQFQFTQQTTSNYTNYNLGTGLTATDGYCQYQCPLNPQSVSKNANGTSNLTYTCTGTAQKKGPYDIANNPPTGTPVPISQPTSPGTTPGSGECWHDANGLLICSSTSASQPNCGTVNGVSFCSPTASGQLPSVDGVNVQSSDPKNCVTDSKGVLCIVPPGDPSAQGCATYNGVTTCYSTTPKVTSNQTATTNADGSVTKTTTSTDNVQGDGTMIVQQTTASNGNVTTVTSGSLTGADGSLLGGNSGKGNQGSQTDCDKNPNHIECTTYGSNVDDTIATVDALASVGFNPTPVGSAGSCPSPQTLNLSFKTIYMSWQPECDFATSIQPLVIASAYLAAAFMISGSVREQ